MFNVILYEGNKNGFIHSSIVDVLLTQSICWLLLNYASNKKRNRRIYELGGDAVRYCLPYKICTFSHTIT